MSQTLADKAYDILEDKIVRLVYKPGELISEKQLSEELGIGRMPIREAIKRLENAHLIKIMPRRGMMVTEIKLEEVFLQIEVRRLLERLIAKRAARFANASERKRLFELADAYEKVTQEGTPEEALEVDNEFNKLVMECARNPFAAASIKPYHALSRRQYYHNYNRDTELIKQINLAHCDLMRTIAKGNETLSEEMLDKLLDLILELYKKSYMEMM